MDVFIRILLLQILTKDALEFSTIVIKRKQVHD